MLDKTKMKKIYHNERCMACRGKGFWEEDKKGNVIKPGSVTVKANKCQWTTNTDHYMNEKGIKAVRCSWCNGLGEVSGYRYIYADRYKLSEFNKLNKNNKYNNKMKK